MTYEIKVLDHGYVKLVESWGSDERIIESARMSTGKGFLGWGPVHESKCPKVIEPNSYSATFGCDCNPKPGDEKLLKFLYDNKHHTPFEMAGMTIEVQAPIFVFREWHRHRTQSYNEMSARYIPLPDVNYIPSMERLMMNARGNNKQAGTTSDAEILTEENARKFQNQLKQQYASAQELYELSLKAGVPKELARVHLPVARYSRMRASANLRNWLGFLALRTPSNAQWEIREYANAVGSIVGINFPRVWRLFHESANG